MSKLVYLFASLSKIKLKYFGWPHFLLTFSLCILLLQLEQTEHSKNNYELKEARKQPIVTFFDDGYI